MYRDIGEYISKQSENAEYGDAFVQKLADFFAENYPDLKGFNRRGEFALSRSLSPTMVSEYNLKLIDKKLLQKKLKEYIELAGAVSDEE